MRKHQVVVFVAATLALGLTGAASASALTQSASPTGSTLAIQLARHARLSVQARSAGAGADDRGGW